MASKDDALARSDPAMTIDDVMQTLLRFRDSRDWKRFHTPENLAKSISIETAELLEHFQWGDDFRLDEVKNELADILIYCLLMADSISADPIQIMVDKIRINDQRFPVARVRGTSGK